MFRHVRGLIRFGGRRSLIASSALGATLALCGCEALVRSVPLPPDQHLKSIPRGASFTNEAELIAIGPQIFLFVQPEEASKRFRFTTHRDVYDPASQRYRRRAWTIEPETMITTGASVPRAVWSAKGLGPMDFMKAAIIHDWLFEAHHRWQIAAHGIKSGDPAARARHRAALEKYKLYAAAGSDTIPGTQELSIADAADIMVEAIALEMDFNDHCLAALDKIVASRESPAEKAAAGKDFTELRKALEVGRRDQRTLQQYSWAIRSPFAMGAWDPKSKADLVSPHSSTLEVVRRLEETSALQRAVVDGVIAPRTHQRLLRMLKEEQTRQADLMAIPRLAHAAATAPADASLGLISSTSDGTTARSVQLQVAKAVRARPRGGHTSARLPSTPEVRFYHYPEDKPEAERILAELEKRGVRGGRVSFVIDPSQPRRAFQVALPSGSVTTPATNP